MTDFDSTFRVWLTAVLTCCAVLYSQTAVAQDAERNDEPKAQFPPASVVLSKVFSIKRSSTESFIGTAMPIRKSIVGSPVGGRVIEVFVEEGQRVGLTQEKSEFDGSILGAPIVQLRTTTLDMEIETARVELKQRELEAEELTATLPIEIEQAQANVAEIQSRLDYSRGIFERFQELFKTSGVSERELQEASATFRSQSELLISSQATLRKLTATRQTRIAQVDTAVENQKAEVRRLLEMHENYTIRAPFDGYVIGKMTELGQWVAPGQAIVEMVQLDPIELVVNVPQSFVQPIQQMLDRALESKTKAPVQVAIDSVDQLFEGELTQIVPQADLRSRAFPVKVRLANPVAGDRHLIKAGMLGRANFFVGDETDVLMVKKDALVLGPQNIVFIADTDPETKKVTARQVPVEIGATLGQWIQIKGLLNGGDRVVVQGNERLIPGQELAVLSEQSDGPVGE